MKIEIIENKVFVAGKDGAKDQHVPKGTILEVSGDTLPGHLIGKARIVSSPEGKTLLTGIEALRSRYEELTGEKPHPKAKAETLQKAIVDAEAKVAADAKAAAEADAKLLDDLRTEYFELTEQIADEALDVAALQATIAQLKAK